MVRKCRTRWHKTPGNLLFLQISQTNILKQLINTWWCRNVLSFRKQQKVQIVFKKDTQALFFFPGEFQISADTLRQKGRFSFSLKSICFSLSKKTPNENSLHPKQLRRSCLLILFNSAAKKI